ncbi:MAG: PAS domain S-box protein [Deltaproteobacteria bacterium]|nr:PAS domain S-box protein [Deltaproteobacteria bacterium]
MADDALDRFFELSVDMLCVAGVDGYFRRVNPAFDALGYGREELLSLPFLELVHPDDRAATQVELDKLARGTRTVGFENRYRCRDGCYRSLSWNAAPDAAGNVYAVARDVTEQRRAEQALERWAHVFENAGWGIVIGSRDGTTLERINAEFARMHGWSVEELVGRPILDVFAPEVRHTIAGHIQRSHAKGRHTFESVHLRKDGTTFPVLVDVTAVRDASGEVLYRAVHVHDDSERRRAEDSVREANRFLEAVIENIPHMVFVKDAERLAFVRFNRAGEELLGLSRAELLGKNDYDFFPKEQAEFFQAKDRLVLRDGTLVDIPEEPIQTKRGRRLLQTKKVPILDGDGRPRFLLGISEDITELKAATESRARLAAIVESSDDAIIARTLEGVVTSWNESAERMFGYSAAEMIGQPISSLFPARIEHQEAALAARIVAGERITHYETVRRRKDGSEIDVSVTLSPIRDCAGTVSGISKIVRDITASKRMQRELVAAKEATEAANAELEAFSYSVAHDLRAPLRSIDGFSQALLEDYAGVLDDEGSKYLRYVREAAQLMAQLIDDLLNLSRVTRAELVRERVDLSALASSMLARLASTYPGRDVEAIVEDGLMVEGDPRLLAVALDNLLGNAWKFTSKRARARIELGAVTRDGAPTFFVRDNGAGFDMTYANKLFGVFQRLHSMTEFEGTGVGLATVQRIIRRHGGRVWAEGEVGVGATLYFTLP